MTDQLSTDDLAFSFEFFPPKSAAMEERLWLEINRLEPLDPRFVSVTYGAGGSTRERTHRLVGRIRAETPLEPAAHLTCVGATREEMPISARNSRNRPPRANVSADSAWTPMPQG